MMSGEPTRRSRTGFPPEGYSLVCTRTSHILHTLAVPPIRRFLHALCQFPRRYDTRFFVAALPRGQQALHSNSETVEGIWIGPREALARWVRSDFPLVFVTQRHLERLAACSTQEELMQFAQTKPIVSVMPDLYPQTQEPFIPKELDGRW